MNFETNVPPISINIKEYSESNYKLEELELIKNLSPSQLISIPFRINQNAKRILISFYFPNNKEVYIKNFILLGTELSSEVQDEKK